LSHISLGVAGGPESYEDLLVQALLANAAGECPASLMAPNLKAACDRDLPRFIHTLNRLGALKSTAFQGMRNLPSGPAEVYKVTFVHGEMTFTINAQDDGKAVNLLTLGPPRWEIDSKGTHTAAQL
jgi:hypothetical protein